MYENKEQCVYEYNSALLQYHMPTEPFFCLQDVSPVIDETPPSDTPLQKALEAISYIGVIISIICLTVTVISYLANKSIIAII